LFDKLFALIPDFERNRLLIDLDEISNLLRLHL
jgi:hypothetical protein